ncbi:peptidase M17 [Mesoplasma syrphidae]|uniref:Probable cytosol aminopeptidase n=1 Tax=Mesoplasma syrphidae TaxID=225999 RepID=A0A2K9C4T6_9MOLU|nr:M17 family metallopeptidase [Mesoplasma syrphidae]AUF83297.1 peptidase M17 [Mesoplasma syrphidae]
MITLNQKHEELTLIAIDGEQAPKYVIANEGATTLIANENKIYLVLKAGNANPKKQVANALAKFVGTNKYNVNIDFDAILKLTGVDKTELFNTIVETISFVSHKQVNFKKDKDTANVVYNILTAEDFSKVYELAKIKTEFINFARDLQDTPPNLGTAIDLADKIVDAAKEIKNLKITVLNKKDIEKLGMGLLLSVNAGSSVEPRVVVAEYIGDETKPKTALVGKGITFDSGGYNLKPSQFMEGMKFDMSGAAIMLSTVMALAKAEAKTNVVGVGCFTDNRIGSTATLPESVITSMNGLTVEINNTDAEGRLVLADGITYAIREKAATRVIEASTLTGAITIALGRWATGTFTHDDALWNELEGFSKITGEQLWRMPIFSEHLEKVKKDTVIADLTNAAKGREAGSSTAAAFLNEFAEGKPFVHLDIAGTADVSERGTGVMLKTLFEMLSK